MEWEEVSKILQKETFYCCKCNREYWFCPLHTTAALFLINYRFYPNIVISDELVLYDFGACNLTESDS